MTAVFYVLSPSTPSATRPNTPDLGNVAVDVAAARASMLLGGSIHSIHDGPEANEARIGNGGASLHGTPVLISKRQLLNSPTAVAVDKPLRRLSFLSKLTRLKLHIKKPEKMPATLVSSSEQPTTRSKTTDTVKQKHFNNKPISSCPVCFDDDKHMFTIKSCGDQICADCMHDYVCTSMFKLNLVSVSGQVECPMTNCKALISAAEAMTLLDEPERQRLQWLRTLRQIDASPTLVWCPRPGCCTPVDKFACHVPTEAILSAGATYSAQNPPPWFVRCMCCATTFCINCLGSPQMHRENNKTSDTSMDSGLAVVSVTGGCANIKAFLDETLRLLPDDVKHCPSCHIPVVRGDGCAQMFCWNCRHVFCWWCLANLTDDILLMHFEKGQCQGRLGHSRPNLLWHRLQAVALVAGAGLTMITLSPLMFVAVPIYVIAKHTRKMIKRQRIRRRLSAESALAISNNAAEGIPATASAPSVAINREEQLPMSKALLVTLPFAAAELNEDATVGQPPATSVP